MTLCEPSNLRRSRNLSQPSDRARAKRVLAGKKTATGVGAVTMLPHALIKGVLQVGL